LDKEKIEKNSYFGIILINPSFKTYVLKNWQVYNQELKNYLREKLREKYMTAEYNLHFT